MSNLADKTEYRALKIIATMVRQFEKLTNLDMTKSDDWDSCAARNLLEGIIQSNGYQVNYDPKNPRTILVKEQPLKTNKK
ncbi:hypothetical protein [Proteiniphilum propionicum]|uniref:hypothetical protein n=1 Tax=Proteiniphilum propionicum TaxID=2829812 RepID=UPI001EEA9D39|nr:hypothetical protein [Proteiniphilum propionicum]ULB34342.1 hypothetical protein KDN43_15520 [Proteiniphilum propionicum]